MHQSDCIETSMVPLRDFVGSGIALENDVGARIGRNYNAYLAWEHAELSSGDLAFNLTNASGGVTRMPTSRGGSTDLLGVGIRFSSNPDRIGLLVDILVGYRTLTAKWNRSELEGDAPERLVMKESPFEFRFGAGADIRVHRLLSLSPLLTVGSGVFKSVEWESSNGNREDALAASDDYAPHGWFTLGLGAHMDVGGSLYSAARSR